MKIWEKTVLLFIVVLAITVVTVTTLRGQNPAAPMNQTEATAVQRGVATKKQKEHSKLIRNQGIGNIYELVKKQPASNSDEPDINITTLPGMPELSPTGGTTSPAITLESLTEDADAIVVGRVNSKVSQITETETFIFTDYEFVVTGVLKNNDIAPIAPGNEITVVRPGGVVQTEGRVVRAVDRSVKPLKVGEQYLLFLNYVPATGAYLASKSTSGFHIANNKLVTLTDNPLYSNFHQGEDVTLFISEVETAISTTSRKRTG